jgi:hypothetical protein
VPLVINEVIFFSLIFLFFPFKHVTMEKYRKDDQVYVEQYDRNTIVQLKKLEREEQEELQKLADIELWKKKVKHSMNQNGFHHTGIWRARNKDRILMEQKLSDERKDRLIEENAIPKNIKCNECGMKMIFDIHLFKDNDTTLIFVFKCPEGHFPKKAIRTDGSEYYFTIRNCKKCGGKIVSKAERDANHLKFIDTCSSCGDVLIDEFEFTPEDEKNVSEEDRQKYCSSFVNARTIYEDLEAIANIAKSVTLAEKEKKEEDDLEVDKIERPNIPQLENRLASIVEGMGYIKFQFDKPEIARYVIISFSMQDPSDRKEKESVKAITKAIRNELFPTNWRIMADGISYRLGYLTGRVKSFEQREDLLKIAMEIRTEQGKKVK